MRTPRVGELRRRLVIEAPSDTGDGAGGRTRGWLAVGAVFGAVEPRRRADTVSDGRPASVVTHHVTIRRRAGVASGVRFVTTGGARLAVVATEDADPHGRFLLCLCEEEQG